jgi:hypothetical protein
VPHHQLGLSRTLAEFDRLVLPRPPQETVAPFLGSTESARCGPERTYSDERTGPVWSGHTTTEAMLVPNSSAPVTWCPDSRRSDKDEFSVVVSGTLLASPALFGRSDDVGTLDVVHTPPPKGDIQ